MYVWILFPTANRIVKSREVEHVMKQVDRKFYCPQSPYMDCPQGIGFGVTISAPHMVNFLLIFLTCQCWLNCTFPTNKIVACLRIRGFEGSSVERDQGFGRREWKWLPHSLHGSNGDSYFVEKLRFFNFMYQFILAYQLGEKGKAVGIDHVKGLVEMSIANIQQDQPDLLSSNRVELVGNSFYDFDDE